MNYDVTQKTLIILTVSVVAILMASGLTYVSLSNSEIELRNQIGAEQDVLESHHNRMWQTLQQQADVSDQYRETFEEIYPELMEGRYDSQDAAGMLNINLVKEDHPDFDTSLYQELSRTIESERTSFHQAQSRLIDVHREHKSLVETFPGSLFLSSRDAVDITTVSSTRTQETFESGVDDDIDLFD